MAASTFWKMGKVLTICKRRISRIASTAICQTNGTVLQNRILLVRGKSPKDPDCLSVNFLFVLQLDTLRFWKCKKKNCDNLANRKPLGTWENGSERFFSLRRFLFLVWDGFRGKAVFHPPCPHISQQIGNPVQFEKNFHLYAPFCFLLRIRSRVASPTSTHTTVSVLLWVPFLLQKGFFS